MNLPTELTDLKQWICWLLNQEGQKIPKAINGLEARANDPDTWSAYEDAEPAATWFQGLAFVFSGDDPYTGIDLDNCLDENGTLKDWAIPIVSRFDGVSYAEISPSGNGIKFITRGSKISGSRCVHQFIGQKEQVECYDHDRYWCITGNVYARNNEIRDGQNAIDWLCETYLKKDKPKKPAPSPTQPAVSRGCDLERRCQSYLGSIPLPAEGERNSKCFSTGGHLKTIVDDYGSSLPDDRIVALVQQWAAPSGISAEEIEAAVRSSFVNGSLPDAKPPQERQQNYSNDHVEPEVYTPVVYEDPVPVDDATKLDDADLPAELFSKMPGLMGQFYDWCMETCLYPQPEPFLGAALSLMSVLTGRKIEGYRGIRTNMYCLTAAPSGSGKNHARKCIQRVLFKAGGENLIGAEGFTSGSAIIQELNHHAAKIFQLDEFGQTLEQMSHLRAPQHVKAIEDELCKLYTAADEVYMPTAFAKRENSKTIDQPHCVLHATTTPGALWNAMSNETVDKGLLGRFTLFEGYYQQIDAMKDCDISTPPESLMKRVEWWVNFNPGGGNMSSMHPKPTRLIYQPEAADRIEGHTLQCANKRVNEDGLRAAIWSRTAERTQKLALLRACSRNSSEVSSGDADWAVRLSNAMTRKLCRRIVEGVSDNDHDRLRKKVLKKIREGGQLTKREVTRKTFFCRDSRERDGILAELIESGHLDLVDGHRGNQAVKLYQVR